MKVLKSGNIAAPWSIEATCTGHGFHNDGCGAELLVELADLARYGRSEDDPEALRESVGFQCPECKVGSEIRTVPEHVYRRLPNFWGRERARKKHGDG
jgi:hypothetical protein